MRGLMLIVVVTAVATGCNLFPKREAKAVPVRDVINQVKLDLEGFGDYTWIRTVPASPQAECKSAGGTHVVMVTPTDARITLKTVRTVDSQPSAGLESPLGVLSIDPSYSGVYARTDTNTLEIQLATPEVDKETPKQVKEFPPVVGGYRPLFATIINMATEIAYADHLRKPCLTPKSAKATIHFSVVEKQSGGVTIKVLGLKLGNKRTVADELHQSLDVTFSLVGSSPAYMHE